MPPLLVCSRDCSTDGRHEKFPDWFHTSWSCKALAWADFSSVVCSKHNSWLSRYPPSIELDSVISLVSQWLRVVSQFSIQWWGEYQWMSTGIAIEWWVAKELTSRA
jgi:hypothetical protein